MSDLIKELNERLLRIGIKERNHASRTNFSPAEKSLILKVVIAGMTLSLPFPLQLFFPR